MVACGGQHTLFLSHENDVFAVGDNTQGQLGISSNEYDHQSTPRRVALFNDKAVTMIQAGTVHSAALTVEGYAYTWGSNNRGQLGLADSISHKANANIGLPKLVE